MQKKNPAELFGASLLKELAFGGDIFGIEERASEDIGFEDVGAAAVANAVYRTPQSLQSRQYMYINIYIAFFLVGKRGIALQALLRGCYYWLLWHFPCNIAYYA